MDVKKLLILIALTLPGWLLAQNYADYKLYAPIILNKVRLRTTSPIRVWS